MMKKILLIIFSIFLLVIINGCNGKKGFEFNEQVLDNNVEVVDKILKPLNKVTSVDISDYTIYNSSYYNYGFLFVKDNLDRFNCLSLFTNKLMFDFADDISLGVISDSYGYYVKVTHSDNDITVYDAFGQIVLPKAAYTNIQISGRYDSEYNELGKVVNNVYHETINYWLVGSEGIDNKKEYIINQTDKTRTIVLAEEDELTAIKRPEKVDLKEYGLDDYYLINIEGTLYVFKTNTKTDNANLINVIHLNDYSIYSIFDGKIFCQNKVEVSLDSKDFDLEESFKKYKLFTYVIDLLNGEKNEIDIDYKINSIKPFYDENNIAKYAYVNIKHLKGDNLYYKSNNIIINSQGEMVNDVGVDYIVSLKKVSEDRYFNGTSYILNSKLEPTTTFSKFTSKIVYSDKLIITSKDDNYGAIDYDGNILIPFEYKELSDQFFNGKTYGVNNDGKKYIIDTNNNKTEISKSDQLISAGLLVSTKYDKETAKNIYRIYDYDNNTISSFGYLSKETSSFVKCYTIFGNYVIAKFVIAANNYKYVVIDKTLVEVK